MEWILAFIIGAGMGAGLVWCSLIPPKGSWEDYEDDLEATVKDALGITDSSWEPLSPLTADEQPTWDCECSWEFYKTVSEEFYHCTRGLANKDCPVHFPKGAK